MKWKQWLDQTIPAIVNVKYFLCVLGSIFFVGIVTKWIVVVNYDRLIRKAENMTNPKNATLRQIKMKFEGVKQVNGSVANPMLFVRRHLNRCKAGIFSLNRLDNVIRWCIMLSIGLAGALGLELYVTGSGKTTAMAYIMTGCFFGFALEMIDRCTHVKERQTELAYVIVDFLENNAMAREDSRQEMGEAVVLEAPEISQEETENTPEDSIALQEEQILNQVIGEFLQ